MSTTEAPQTPEQIIQNWKNLGITITMKKAIALAAKQAQKSGCEYEAGDNRTFRNGEQMERD